MSDKLVILSSLSVRENCVTKKKVTVLIFWYCGNEPMYLNSKRGITLYDGVKAVLKFDRYHYG